MKLRKFLLLLNVGLLVASCDKDKEYDTVYKEEKITSKAEAVNTTDTFLYVPSTLGVPKDVSSARAFFQGDSKIVKMKFTENNLEILELEEDDRFNKNELNNTPVLTIPVSYIDYKCQENSQGDCTNQEVVNTELTWDQKNFFKPNFEALKINEVNSLDLFNLDPSCVSLVDTGLVDYEMNQEALNIVLEKTYKVSTAFNCIANLYYSDTMSSAGFKVKFFYSLVKLSSLETKGYKPVNYPIQDHSAFGFFKTKKEVLEDNFDHSRKKVTYLLNRWDPNKTELVYYLNSTFNKEENKISKQATYDAFEKINFGLKKANVNFKVVLKEPSDKVKEGDLRYNTINLIDEPLAIGLLGYGPTVANPATGEIVQGHVNMYSGVLKSTIRRTYDSMVDISKERYVAPVVEEESSEEVVADTETQESEEVEETAADGNSGESEESAKRAAIDTAIAKAKQHFHRALQSHKVDVNRLDSMKNISETLSLESLKKMNELTLVEKEVNENEKFLEEDEGRLTHLGQIAADTCDLVNYAELAKNEIAGVRDVLGISNANDVLPDFDSLSEDMQTKVINHILPKLYIQTLVHEMGHNLGLRHNFMGSFDKENFMTADQVEEAKSHFNDSKEVAPAYSSIMDYAQSDLNALDVFGNYDLAALRFGYAREVVAEDGTVTKITDSLKASPEKGKYYMFCTDENAELSSRCNRHDEGSTFTEIAESFVLDYDRGYKYRNFRNGRNDFSTYGIIGSVSSRNWSFRRARVIYEEYETYENIFGKDLMEAGCSPEQVEQYPVCATVNDIRSATLMVANKFLEIIKTPDLSCAVALAETPDVTAEVLKLREIYESDLKYSMSYIPKTCFDENVKNHFAKANKVVKGEAGKFLNHIKDPNDKYVYSSDIGVRGVWHDKVLAMKYLSNRYSGTSSTETLQGSMADITSIQQGIFNVMSHILIGQDLIDPVPFKKEDGSEYVEKYSLTSDDTIYEQPDGRVIRYLGLPSSSEIELNRILINTFVENNQTTDPKLKELSEAMTAVVSVYKLPFYTNVGSDISKVVIDDSIYTATSQEQLAKIMLDSIDSKDILQNVAVEELKKIVSIKEGNIDIPESFTEDQKIVSNVSISLLDQVKSLVEAGTVFTEEQLVPMIGEELAKSTAVAFTMTVEEIQFMIDFLTSAQNPPADASEAVKSVYGMPVSTINDFINGELDTKINEYMVNFDFLYVK